MHASHYAILRQRAESHLLSAVHIRSIAIIINSDNNGLYKAQSKVISAIFIMKYISLELLKGVKKSLLLRKAGICASIHRLIYINGFTSRGCASRLPTLQVVRSTREEISNGLGAFCAGLILI